MKKNLLALAIASAAFGTQAVAVELYNAQGTTFSLGGHVAVALNDSENGDLGVIAASPRINFNATQELGNGFTADAKGEWALNLLDGGENSFTTRLGYIGLTHAEMGRAVVGTQWAPYYDVASATDMPIAFANTFIYESAKQLGTWRADDMVSYRNAFDFGNAGELNFGVAWTGAQEDKDANVNYDDRVQLALDYTIQGVSLGYAMTTGDVNKETAQGHVFSASYGSYGKGLYVAGVYELGERMFGALEDTHAMEVIAAYKLANGVNLSVNYETVSDEVAEEDLLETTALQAEYNFTSKFVGFAGYEFDLLDSSSNDQWTAGVRYYL